MSGPSTGATRWQGFFGRYVIWLALASVLVVTGVVLVNRGIDERVAKITRVKLALAEPAARRGQLPHHRVRLPRLRRQPGRRVRVR